ncbi:hypothetical protein FDUTEX481_05476 [Tolypothrix sp. PCC 7601]|nr:hypothetical protein FDUTEX481_05476 [Tolypothrix sp. PCC 7601]
MTTYYHFVIHINACSQKLNAAFSSKISADYKPILVAMTE